MNQPVDFGLRVKMGERGRRTGILLLREEMNELRKYSMIAGSINSTLKV